MKTRAAAVKVLNSLNKNYFDYEIKIDSMSKRLNYSQQDRDFLYILIKGVIKYSKLLDFYIKSTYKKSLNKIEPTGLNLLRLGIFQGRILKTPGHAYVFETVQAAKELKLFRLTGLVNGILRNLPSEEKIRQLLSDKETITDLSILHSHPDWLTKRWLNNFGKDKTEKLLKFNNEYTEIYFRHNPLKITATKLFQELSDKGFNYKIHLERPIPYFTVNEPGRLLKSKIFKQGFCSVQDLSQAFPIILLDPRKDEKILDICGAPGGKSTFIAQLQNDETELLVSDISKRKIKLIENEVSRLGIKSIKMYIADATNYQYEKADKILIDAPCTGTGVLTRRADMRWNRKPEDLEKLIDIQKMILENASKYIKHGGTIVYSTCSIEYEENQGIIDSFLQNHPKFIVESAIDFVPEKYCMGDAVQIFPHSHNICGSYAIRLKRR